MGRKQLDPEGVRETKLQVRITAPLRDRLVQTARERGVSLQALVNGVLLAECPPQTRPKA